MKCKTRSHYGVDGTQGTQRSRRIILPTHTNCQSALKTISEATQKVCVRFTFASQEGTKYERRVRTISLRINMEIKFPERMSRF